MLLPGGVAQSQGFGLSWERSFDPALDFVELPNPGQYRMRSRLVAFEFAKLPQHMSPAVDQGIARTLAVGVGFGENLVNLIAIGDDGA